MVAYSQISQFLTFNKNVLLRCTNVKQMKLWAIIFFLLPLLGCTYVGWHVWRILPLTAVWRTLVIVAMAACFALFILNFVLGLDRVPLPWARVMYNVGNSSLFILLYLTMLFLVLDFGQLLHLVPSSFLKNSVAGSLTVLAVMVGIFVYGNTHYYNKARVSLELDTKGRVERPLKLVMMSDLHLGYHNPRTEMARWVDSVNTEQPDLVLIAGDIIDISVRPLLEEGVAAEFRRLQAPVFACLGNHEYYSGEPKAQQFFLDAGIRVLRDEAVNLPELGHLTIIGRDDRTNPHRKSVAQLMKTFSPEKTNYTIVLDHQPYHLDRSAKAGVDFQFSGHTHYGQVWPISWITKAIYECSYGSYQLDSTHFYISSGIGIWGGKFRIGTNSEYAVITITPNK